MKPSTLALALLATVSAAAQTAPAPEPAPAAPPSSPLSAEVAKDLNASLPQSAPARPTAAAIADIRQQSIDRAPARQLDAENTPADPEVVELPKMTVKQQPRPRPRLNDHTILGPKAFNEELLKKNFTGLDRALNKFTLPLFGTGAAERAREDYNIAQKRQFMDDVLTIAKAVEQTDPEAAKTLRETAAKP
jgi:hypothetical protein